MKNPCKECLLINNCTAICEEKKNFQTLLKNAMQRYGYGRNCTSKKDQKLYTLWIGLRVENEKDMLRIVNRSKMLKEGQSLI